MYNMCKLTGPEAFKNIAILNEFLFDTRYPAIGTEHSVIIAIAFYYNKDMLRNNPNSLKMIEIKD